jgi:hypothetical protein
VEGTGGGSEDLESSRTNTLEGYMSNAGFVAATFDVPFAISVPDGAYLCFDPVKQIGVVQTRLREGSRAFFRSLTLRATKVFSETKDVASSLDQPKEARNYKVVSELKTGEKIVTLNVDSGASGGYSECKLFSEVTVTFLADDLQAIAKDSTAFERACGVLNPFLDKYRVMSEDHTISHVSTDRNFYFVQFHTSPLTPEEASLAPEILFQRIGNEPRKFLTTMGHGAFTTLRANSFETLAPRRRLSDAALATFLDFAREDYQLPLFYDLLLEAIDNFQRRQENRLAIVHAETAFEVYVRESLTALMVSSGISEADAAREIEHEPDYWGIKRKLKKLDHWTEVYCLANGSNSTPFLGSSLYKRWESLLYAKRNEAVHAGTRRFSFAEAVAAIAVSKECITTLEARVPALANRVQLDPSMSRYRPDAGEVKF